MRTPSSLNGSLRFDGSDYRRALDQTRQIKRAFDLVSDGKWRTLEEIATATGDPAASVSAQLRHLRKRRFGQHAVLQRRRSAPAKGLFEYRVLVGAPDDAA
jgi:hypothetical protein